LSIWRTDNVAHVIVALGLLFNVGKESQGQTF
jgi:hypothetical protein